MGKVTSFDEERGLGEILADEGDTVPFHCTSIANRQRRIPQGARVTFATTAGHLGLLEATGVTVVTLSADSDGWSVGGIEPPATSGVTDEERSSG